MKTKILMLLAMVAIAISACKKDPNKGLTPETQTGANTFSCKINGENFIARQSLFGPKAIFVEDEFDKPNPLFRIKGSNKSVSPYVTIEIQVYDKIDIGTYTLGGSSQNYGKIEYRTPSNEYDIYQTSISLTGVINFSRIDRINHIYSGSFRFNSSNGITNNVITMGRFDVGNN